MAPDAPDAGTGRPLVIGHRGASAARPENTVEAFRHALEVGADWVELDVRRTADGALVIHHDATVYDGRALVDVERAELPESVPTFAEALVACRGLGINVEIKNHPVDPDFDPEERIAEEVAEVLVVAADAGELELVDILVTSFHAPTIGRVRERAPSVATGLLAADLRDPVAVVEAAVSGGHVALNPWDPFVDERLAGLVAEAGLLLYPWTVDDPARMAELLDLGAHGVITNVPDVGRRVVDERR